MCYSVELAHIDDINIAGFYDGYGIYGFSYDGTTYTTLGVLGSSVIVVSTSAVTISLGGTMKPVACSKYQ